MIRKIVRRLLPYGSRRNHNAKVALASLRVIEHPNYDANYNRWMVLVEPEGWRAVVPHTDAEPLISVVVPCFNTPARYLDPLIESLHNQSFAGWEAILVDASDEAASADRIRDAATTDSRFRYLRAEDNAGISANTNAGIAAARGAYVAFVDHDDTLSVHALNEVAGRLADDPGLDILYSDEDKLSEDGRWRHTPLFKPGWSPHTFMQVNYTNHLSVIRRDLVESVGRLRPEFDGAQDYDLLLRIHATTPDVQVGHINRVLYHWREASGSTAHRVDAKTYAFDAGVKAHQEVLDASPFEGTVERMWMRPGFYRHIITPTQLRRAEVYVAPTERLADNTRLAERLRSMTSAPALAVSFRPCLPEELEAAPPADGADTAVVKIRMPVLPDQATWLQELVGILQLPDVNEIAPLIVSADAGLIVDSGLVEREGELVGLFADRPADEQSPVGPPEWVRDVDALSGAVVASAPDPTDDGYRVVWSHVRMRRIPAFDSASPLLSRNLTLDDVGGLIPDG
ncbi:glycosyltransferase family 2 protein [Euzebya tangerina]|uniref:glycosyltransferase family 2 protein n=1 Tax=Euzebya tangerina TaxID=591198 RepID=UPI000E317B69|nr:glycosyltransferase [Euzebya tangerina]